VVITLKYNGDQKRFHHYWLPLVYKHGECTFVVHDESNKLIYPKDAKNLKINQNHDKGPIMHCVAEKIPTYRAMVVFQKKPKNWKGDWSDLGEMFYDIETLG